jgi:hypothetical protein
MGYDYTMHSPNFEEMEKNETAGSESGNDVPVEEQPKEVHSAMPEESATGGGNGAGI